ncbi:hypothetical protein MATL_G00106550 [Megalops atlanticus]|uniref:Tripartite motif-containing protein 35-like n=1 Tax=Megalops atlanticus TaxID=7932 RepID=A0A9D3Q2A6_MEGAT|nr:hypothetical protein MATL_G00106550 [Megalops atlanticus]
MAANASFLEQELCCSVCCEIFKDPVVLKCSHSFCRVCLQQCWREKSSRECPICRRKSTVDQPPVSLALKNIVEYHLKQRNEDHCSVHGEKLKFFCEKDKETLCSMCQTSEKHRNHQVCSLEEAALEMKEELKTALSSNKAMLKRFTKVKQECEKSSEHIRGQAEHVERQVKAEFEKLHQFLRDEEEARLAELREEEKLKRQRMKEMIQNITRHISTLSDKITAIERAMDTEGISLLKTYKDTMKRAQCTLQSPKLPSGALIDVAKHIGNLKFRVCEKMMGMVQYTH